MVIEQILIYSLKEKHIVKVNLYRGALNMDIETYIVANKENTMKIYKTLIGYKIFRYWQDNERQ